MGALVTVVILGGVVALIARSVGGAAKSAGDVEGNAEGSTDDNDKEGADDAGEATTPPLSVVKRREKLQPIAESLEVMLQWPGLSRFLQSKAYEESRFNPKAINKKEIGRRNAARGLLQLRPDSVFVHDLKSMAQTQPEALLDARVNLVLAAWYAYRLRTWGGGKSPTWIALARGWAYPSKVKDFAETHPRSQKVRRNFPKTAFKLYGQTQWVDEDAFEYGPGNWTNMPAILSYMGRPIVDGKIRVPEGEW